MKEKYVVCRLDMLMAKKGIRSVSEVAKATGLSRLTLDKMYKHQAKIINYPTTIKVCTFFDCQFHDLYELVDEEEYNRIMKVEKEYIERVRKGYVYFAKSGIGLTKIGKTSNLQKRIKQLEKEVQSNLEVIHTIPSDNAYQTEQSFHKRFEEKRVNGEWFLLDELDIEEIKKSVAATTDPK